jgi:hypothetical protein
MAWKLSVSAANGALARGRSKVLFKAVLPKLAFRLCFVAASWVLLPQAGGLWNFWQVRGKSAGIRARQLS